MASGPHLNGPKSGSNPRPGNGFPPISQLRQGTIKPLVPSQACGFPESLPAGLSYAGPASAFAPHPNSGYPMGYPFIPRVAAPPFHTPGTILPYPPAHLPIPNRQAIAASRSVGFESGDSGHESGGPVDSPAKVRRTTSDALDLTIQSVQRRVLESLSPSPSPEGHRPRSSSFTKSLKSGNSVLASFLRGEDVCFTDSSSGNGSHGTGSSRGSSPRKLQSDFSPTLEDIDQDADVSSEGSADGKKPHFPTSQPSLSFGMMRILNSVHPNSQTAHRSTLQRFTNGLLHPKTEPPVSEARKSLGAVERTSPQQTGYFNPLTLPDFGPLRLDLSRSSTSSPHLSSGEWEASRDSFSLTPDGVSPGSTESQSSGDSRAQLAGMNAKCAICDDRASGFHYGVVSCEGCKGFFRRSVQKNIEYSCHKENQCAVNRITRNRCQACRFAKCLQAGMTRESVRQDRNRKRKVRNEKEEKELEETARLQRLIQTVVQAHNETMTPLPFDCPLSDAVNWIRSELLGVGSRGMEQVIRFCRRVPGLAQLTDADQRMLLRQGCLEIWVLRCAFLFCGRSDISLEQYKSKSGSAEVGLDSLIECISRIRDSLTQLEVFLEEIALLSAICLMCPTRGNLSNPYDIECLQEPLVEALRVQIHLRKKPLPDAAPQSPSNVFPKLLMKISDIRAVVMRDLENIVIVDPNVAKP